MFHLFVQVFLNTLCLSISTLVQILRLKLVVVVYKTMKFSPIKGFGLCIMSKCLNSDKPNKVLTEEVNHSKENENHSKENEGLIPKESSIRSNNEEMQENTHLKPHSYSPWVSSIYQDYDGPATNAR